jgi:hypothetical protein
LSILKTGSKSNNILSGFVWKLLSSCSTGNTKWNVANPTKIYVKSKLHVNSETRKTKSSQVQCTNKWIWYNSSLRRLICFTNHRKIVLIHLKMIRRSRKRQEICNVSFCVSCWTGRLSCPGLGASGLAQILNLTSELS